MKEELEQYISSTNLAEQFDDKLMTEIGIKLKAWFDEDCDSRKEWLNKSNEYLRLATQVVDKKTYPWPDAANVKYPLLTTAAMQFAARAYPALVPGPRLVQGLVIGRDEMGLKQQSAERIGAHMSYQLLWEMHNWEEDMDRLCLMLPIVGCLFKKTWHDPMKKMNVSDLILPQDLVIDYYAKSLEDATRKSHVIYRTRNQVLERINKGLYLDVLDKLGRPTSLSEDNRTRDEISGQTEPTEGPATPYKFVECHCWWDLDEDGYEEPYIVTFHYDSTTIVRIVARFSIEDVELNDKDEIVAIKATEYFTKFGFIPNPDGGIYDLGFGVLLGALNETVNTLTNQLLDSGTINNLQSGFLGRGIRVRSGNSRFQPGEWKPVDFTGDDIKKHIFPLPTKEPSEVLFKLLDTLVISGKELASVAEIMVGKMPGQNTPATTTMATIEQGLKVFTAIYKRIYRALGKEYEKLFKLNGIYLPDSKIYFTINEPEGQSQESVEKTDYSMGVSVKPNADPNIVSSAQKLMKVQAMGGLLQLGTINPIEYTKRYLVAIEETDITKLLNTQPPPNPEAQKMQMEMQMKQQDAQMTAQLEQMRLAMEEKSHEMEMRFKAMEMQLKEREMEAKLMFQAREHEMKMRQGQEQHALDMTTKSQQSQITTQQMREQGAVKTEQMRKQGDAKIEVQKKTAAAKPKPKAKE